MNDLLRSFGRALAGAFHPAMLFLTFVPFLVAAGVWGGLLYAFWQPVIDALRPALEHWWATAYLYHLFDLLGYGTLRNMIGPFVVIILSVPLIVITVLLLIVAISMPRVIRHLTARQYAMLEARHGGSWYGSVFHSLWTTVVCIVLLCVSLPFWFFPPFFAIVPPLLWGWLTYRVMAYDTLADYASTEERRAVLHLHRWPLLAVGTIAGALGAAPTLLWLGGVLSVILLPALAAVAIWLYVVVFVFTGLWFQFYCLEALLRHRSGQAPDGPPDAGVIDVTPR